MITRLCADQNVLISDGQEKLVFIGPAESRTIILNSQLWLILKKIAPTFLKQYHRSLWYPRGCGFITEVLSHILAVSGVAHERIHQTKDKHFFLGITLQKHTYYLDFTADQFPEHQQQGALLLSADIPSPYTVFARSMYFVHSSVLPTKQVVALSHETYAWLRTFLPLLGIGVEKAVMPAHTYGSNLSCIEN